MLVGDLIPTDGDAYIKNVSLRDDVKGFQRKIGYCPQTDALIDNLTGEYKHSGRSFAGSW